MSKMPVWFAPILGAIVAGALGFYVGKFEMNFEPPSILPWFVLGSALGGGTSRAWILWFIDSLQDEGIDPISPAWPGRSSSVRPRGGP